MFDGLLVSSYLYRRLATDATIAALVSGVYEDIIGNNNAATQASVFPFISFSVIAQDDVMVNGGDIATTNFEVLVRAIDADTVASGGALSYSGNLDTLASRIHTLLHDVCVPVYNTPGTAVIGQAKSRRIYPYRERFIDGGIEYRHLGGMYEVITNPI